MEEFKLMGGSLLEQSVMEVSSLLVTLAKQCLTNIFDHNLWKKGI